MKRKHTQTTAAKITSLPQETGRPAYLHGHIPQSGMPAFTLPYFDLAEKICLAVAGAVFAYSCLRAAVISMSHDEALTYLIHIRGSLGDILGHTLSISSNNHLLNTLLAKLCVSVFGNSEFVLRMPALLGHALYLTGVFLILRSFLKGWPLLVGFGALATNPFLIDFFSCSRGYGLAVGCMTIGIFFLFMKAPIPAIIMLTLSVLSNFAFLYVYLPVMGLAVAGDLIERWREAWRTCVAALASAILLRIVFNAGVIKRFQMVVSKWGGTRGFWTDTVTTLLDGVFYGQKYASSLTIYWSKRAIAFLCLISIILTVSAFIKRRVTRFEYRSLALITALLVIIALGMHAAYALFQIKFSVERAAIYLIPLVGIMITLLLALARQASGLLLRKIGLISLCATLAVILAHNVACVNLTHFYMWAYDANTKEAVNMVYELSKPKAHSEGEFRIGINWHFRPATNYYLCRKRMTWVRRADRKGVDGDYDYYYIWHDQDKGIIQKRNLKVIKYFPASNSSFALPQSPSKE